jgi:hypothetical protein
LWGAVQHSYEPRRGGLGYAVEFREGRDSMQQGGARQGGVAAFKCGIVRWKVGFASGVMTVGRAARATAESTTSSRSVILAVRHVAAGVSKAGKVDAGPAACDSKCSPRT